MGMTFEHRKFTKRLMDIKKDVGREVSVLIGPTGYHGGKNSSNTLTGHILAAHVHGRGVPVRNPMGFDKADREYIRREWRDVLKGKKQMRQVLRNIGDRQVRIIIKRFNTGVDKDGKSFAKYSAAYEKYKTTFGGRKKGQRNRSARPNLTFTGITQASITYEIKDGK